MNPQLAAKKIGASVRVDVRAKAVVTATKSVPAATATSTFARSQAGTRGVANTHVDGDEVDNHSDDGEDDDMEDDEGGVDFEIKDPTLLPKTMLTPVVDRRTYAHTRTRACACACAYVAIVHMSDHLHVPLAYPLGVCWFFPP